MSGVSAFINRIEYMTPSGRPPDSRIITRIIPAPPPKIHDPLSVIGEVTISVAIKNAPSNKPPDNI
jgi:hypothetical protein